MIEDKKLKHVHKQYYWKYFFNDTRHIHGNENDSDIFSYITMIWQPTISILVSSQSKIENKSYLSGKNHYQVVFINKSISLDKSNNINIRCNTVQVNLYE